MFVLSACIHNIWVLVFFLSLDSFRVYMSYVLSALDCSLCICSTYFLPGTVLLVYVLQTFCFGLFSVYMFYILSALDCSLCIIMFYRLSALDCSLCIIMFYRLSALDCSLCIIMFYRLSAFFLAFLLQAVRPTKRAKTTSKPRFHSQTK